MTSAADPTRPDMTIPAIDGFRAIAILFVMASHVGMDRIVPGQFGVTLFFFLSGFLITTLLRREIDRRGRIDFRAFYLRRAVRILPPLYITMAALLALSAGGLIRPIDWRGVPFDLAFLSNYIAISHMPIGLWSLAVEEHFYLGFPLLLALLARRFSFARCAAVCLALCGIVLAIRYGEVARLNDVNAITFWTHTRIDSILFGTVLALWNNPVADEGNVLPIGWKGYVLAAAILAPTFIIRDDAFRQSLRYTIQGLGLIVLFNTAIRDRTAAPRFLDSPIMRRIALLSYTLYLVHSGMILLITGPGNHPLFLTFVALAASFVYAEAMHRWVEEPMARWRRTRERRTRQGSAVTAVSGT